MLLHEGYIWVDSSERLGCILASFASTLKLVDLNEYINCVVRRLAVKFTSCDRDVVCL